MRISLPDPVLLPQTLLAMIELIQFPWSPYCRITQRIVEYGGLPHKLVTIAPGDRSSIWKLTRQRYYKVPVLKDGRTVVFETEEDSQVIAKYLDGKFQLGLFPRKWAGLQNILWRFIENEVEGMTFRLNDIYYREFVSEDEQLNYVRFKERKFGAGCLEQWRDEQETLRRQLAGHLMHFELMLAGRSFLLDEEPRFVDFDLYGMLANLLYTGRHHIPETHLLLHNWYDRMSNISFEQLHATPSARREKLRS